MQDIGLSELAEFMSEYWEYVKKHWNCNDFESLKRDCDALGAKYKHPFVGNLLLAVIDHAEGGNRLKLYTKALEKIYGD